MSADASVAARGRRVHLPWRIVFAIYAVPMMIGLHWPRLDMSVGDVRAPDKIVHFAAFAGLIFLLWTTGWIGRLSVIWLLGMIAAFGLELTQAIPVFGRTFSWYDIIAGWLGVTAMTLALWSFAPIGGEINRLRLRMNAFVFQELFSRLRTWLLTGVSGGLMAIVLGACTGFLLWWFNPLEPESAVMGAFVAAMAGGVAGVYAMLDALARKSRDELTERRPCLSCGFSCAEASVDDRGHGSCPRCQSRFHLGQWIMRAELPRPKLAQITTHAGGFAMLLALVVAAVYVILVLTHLYMPDAIRSVLLQRGMPRDMRLVIDMAVLWAILAFAVRRFRRELAVAVDRQSERCRVCDHDVHATPVERGLGRCGECGTVFVRPV